MKQNNFFAQLNKFGTSTSGATAIEYALIAGGIALVIITAVGLVGQDLENIFTGLAGNL